MKKRPVRANPPVCWLCGKKLACGGWQYEMVEEADGIYRPAHRFCAMDALEHGGVRSFL